MSASFCPRSLSVSWDGNLYWLRIGPQLNRSVMVESAMPPPSRIVGSPWGPARRCSALTSVVVMRAPLAPNGCQIAIAPPLTLVLARVMRPKLRSINSAGPSTIYVRG
jgi:hypothetical protein